STAETASWRRLGPATLPSEIAFLAAEQRCRLLRRRLRFVAGDTAGRAHARARHGRKPWAGLAGLGLFFRRRLAGQRRQTLDVGGDGVAIRGRQLAGIDDNVRHARSDRNVLLRGAGPEPLGD